MYAVVMPFGSGSSLDWTSVTKANPTAENRLAWLSSGVSVEWMYSDRIAHKNEGRIEILVILLGVVSVKFGGLGEEVGARNVGSEWFE